MWLTNNRALKSDSRETGPPITRPPCCSTLGTLRCGPDPHTRGWAALLLFERIGAVYAFVRGEIAFGYNAAD